MGRRGRISAHVAGNTLRPGLRSAAQWYVTGRSVFPAPVMGGFGCVWRRVRDEPQETAVGRFCYRVRRRALTQETDVLDAGAGLCLRPPYLILLP